MIVLAILYTVVGVSRGSFDQLTPWYRVGPLWIRLEYKRADCWIGAYWDRTKYYHYNLWIVPLPMFPIHIKWGR